MNFLLKKNPGDGTITALKETLGKQEGAIVVLEVVGENFDPSVFQRLEDQIRGNPGVPVNLVFDLTQAEHPGRWANTIVGVMSSEKIGEVILPSSTALITVVRDSPDLDLGLHFTNRSVHIDRKDIRILGDLVASHRRVPGDEFLQRRPDSGTELEI